MLHDIRVIKLAQCFAFTRETFQHIWLGSNDRRLQLLDRDEFIGLCVQASIHHTHSALTNFFIEAITLTDERRLLHASFSANSLITVTTSNFVPRSHAAL